MSKLHTAAHLSHTGSGIPLAALWSLTDVYTDFFSHTHKHLLVAFILFLAGRRTHQNLITSLGKSTSVLKQTDYGLFFLSFFMEGEYEMGGGIRNIYLILWNGFEQLRHRHVCTHNPE